MVFPVALAIWAGGCAPKQAARMYAGPDLPPTETALVVVQEDRAGVMIRIEAVDGVRMPNATRELYDRDREAIVRAGPHTVRVGGWVVKAEYGREITLRTGVPADVVPFVLLAPETLTFTAEGGHDYEIQVRRAAFDSEVRQVTVPQRPIHTQNWIMHIADRKDVESKCPECPD
jgi:hypothetical protein